MSVLSQNISVQHNIDILHIVIVPVNQQVHN